MFKRNTEGFPTGKEANLFREKKCSTLSIKGRLNN